MSDFKKIFWRFKHQAPCTWNTGFLGERVARGLLQIHEHPKKTLAALIVSEDEIEFKEAPPST